MKAKFLVAPVAAAAACLAVVGNSSGSVSVKARSAAAHAASAKVASAKSPIVIGIVSPGDGSPVFSWQPQVSADLAFIRAVNKTGGFKGRLLKLDFCNDKNDPNLAITCARQMISDHVVMEAGADDLNGATVATILNKAGIPEVGISAISGGELNSPNVFLNSGNIPGYIAFLGYLAAHHIATAMAGTDNTTAQQLYTIMSNTNTSIHHPYVSQTLVPPTVTDFTPYVADALNSHPQAIMDFFGLQQEEQFFSKVAASGSKVRLFTAYGYSGASQAAAVGGPQEMDRITSFGNFLPLQDRSNPLIKQFDQELAIEKRTGDADASLSLQDGASFGGWLGLWVLQQFVNKGTLNVNHITAATVMHAFKTAKNINMDGVMHPWTPNAPGPTGMSRVSNPYYYMWTYTDGGAKTKLLFPKPVTDAQALAGKFPN